MSEKRSIYIKFQKEVDEEMNIPRVHYALRNRTIAIKFHNYEGILQSKLHLQFTFPHCYYYGLRAGLPIHKTAIVLEWSQDSCGEVSQPNYEIIFYDIITSCTTSKFSA